VISLRIPPHRQDNPLRALHAVAIPRDPEHNHPAVLAGVYQDAFAALVIECRR
jgi:hypothetical protein